MVEAHLADCESCAALFARELNFLNAIRKGAPRHVARPELRARVQKILRVGVAEESRPRRASRMSWLVAAAAVLLLLLLPVLVWRVMKQSSGAAGEGSGFAVMAADNHTLS